MNKHKSNKIKENSNTVRHLIMGQITTTQNLVAIKEVRHTGQKKSCILMAIWNIPTFLNNCSLYHLRLILKIQLKLKFQNIPISYPFFVLYHFQTVLKISSISVNFSQSSLLTGTYYPPQNVKKNPISRWSSKTLPQFYELFLVLCLTYPVNFIKIWSYIFP